MLFGATLKVGDLVSTCKGYNERIKEIYPCWTSHGLSKGRIVYDFDIVTEAGSCCSLGSCCASHLETVEEIVKYWSVYKTKEGLEYLERMAQYGWSFHKSRIVEGIIAGEEVFDSDGQPFLKFAADYEREARIKTLESEASNG